MREGTSDGRHTVSVLAFDGMAPFEFGSVVEVFGVTRPDVEGPWYELRICSLDEDELFAGADTVIVVGVPDPGGAIPSHLVAALRAARARGARIVSICSGVFALAAAGLLDGRAATTHWQYTELLRRRHPNIRVCPDVLYVDEGDILTGAGNAAGLDLCLHLVRRDRGARVANTIARHLLVPPHRAGEQAQLVPTAVPESDDDWVARAMAWALDHLAEPITVGDMAARAHLARRTFLRQFQRRTGTTPMRWVVAQRVRASLPPLERGTMSIEEVAAAVGFASPVTFRHHFTRAMRCSPSAYRRGFRASA
ncbi:helix-turn-helix domain-containing protein [Nocardia sp. NPDC004068]|uniref:helix-turn-helix domain-containing protein n=1 Tax=Nocardia sp. NPDC004068 TaxID=3364303 RepID=UPI00367B7925